MMGKNDHKIGLFHFSFVQRSPCQKHNPGRMVLSVDDVQAKRQCFINRTLLGIQHMFGACRQSVSPIADTKSEMSEILQENLGNLIRGKEGINIKTSGQFAKAIQRPSGSVTSNLYGIKIQCSQQMFYYNLRKIRIVQA